MRKISLGEIDERIEGNLNKVNLQILQTIQSERKSSTRMRSVGEKEALNQLSIYEWKKAISLRKIKKLAKGNCTMITIDEIKEYMRTTKDLPKMEKR
ncbi:hypothetical protein [Bacillus sp. AFS055030]|uniref:hypothetical protein n=1 Tax=Bacillus sp. AFS055030 TaxID=2033507 RepID=UPI000BFD5288|nr:hypothetical protein [Bacillus sp. AFS055030]PGL73372.1 hypothetical protein CN925_00745 [Bacillus sp. AFS055030]